MSNENKIFECSFLSYDKPDKNGRIMPKDVFGDALKNNPNIYVTFGDNDINDKNLMLNSIAAKTIDINYDESNKTFIGQFELLNTPKGNVLKDIINGDDENNFIFEFEPKGTYVSSIATDEVLDMNISHFDLNIRKKIDAKWEISCDGYYPYCSNCYYEPNYDDELPTICPICGANMSNVDDNGEFIG